MSFCPDYKLEELVSPSSCVPETRKLILLTKSARQSTVNSGPRALGSNDAPLCISRKPEIVNKFRQVQLKNKAEHDAAKNALDKFLDVRDADREGKGRNVQYDDYGTAVPSETCVPLYSARRKMFKPLLLPVSTLEKQKHESQAFPPTSVDKPAPAVSLESRNTNAVLPPVPEKPFPEGFRSDIKSAKDCFSKACDFQKWSPDYFWYEPMTYWNGTTVFAVSAVANGYKYEAGEGTSKKKAKYEAAGKALDVIFGATDRRNEH